MKEKLKVAVLFGGQSGEHAISIISARSIMQHIDRSNYLPCPIYIDKQGIWHTEDNVVQPLLTCDEPLLLSQDAPFPKPKPRLTKKLAAFDEHNYDVVFPVLHGPLGEDGTVQGLLDMLGLPYVGAGVLGSAIGMDKAVTKRLALAATLPVAPYLTLTHAQWKSDQTGWLKTIEHTLEYPIFVKPARLGSSVGINKAKDIAQLRVFIEEAFCYDSKILVEKAIRGREIELAVLESTDSVQLPFVSVPGEIIPTQDFYSFDAKYLDPNGADLKVPAELSEAQVKEAQSIAQQAFVAMACQGMARVDLFWDHDSERFLLNEINTIPGFTKISMYPKLMEYTGVSYSQLITRLLQLALNR